MGFVIRAIDKTVEKIMTNLIDKDYNMTPLYIDQCGGENICNTRAEIINRTVVSYS